MQVSRIATKEEFGRLRIDAVKDPISGSMFDDLIDTLQIDGLSNEDKTLFQSIVLDRKVTQEEFDKLSYEQISKFTQMLNRSDMNGNFIPDTFVIFEDLKMAPYLATPSISDDENYNKAVFNVLKNLNLPQEEGFSFINEFSSIVDNEDKIAFENRLSSNAYDAGVRYKTYIGQDMQEFLKSRLSELKEGLNSTSDEVVKKDYERLISIYTQIDMQYNAIKIKNTSELEQYTRNTKPNPIYNNEVVQLYKDIEKDADIREKKEFEQLLEMLDVDNLSKAEKELFREILEDRELSNIEMDSLSYEQMQKISQLISQKDSNGNLMSETSIRHNSRISALLYTTSATKDDDFNRALFDTVKQMEDIQDINNFLLPLKNYINEKLKEYGLSIELDMNKVLDEVISRFEEYHDKSLDDKSKEYYVNAIKQYEEFQEYYNELKK
ncbi:hypothetical protein [Poseidonibacter lekithochrous]|uniref:hypothetical protein n=1 Tax=Poseidonibacter lekithochrous TaxID=1904463 RepID=UPI0008FC2071|nr:hypothetical protein [Poseidonibacter lekithochrous]QKJ22131.1 hypothetical protein ALEK_0848 [Poseidonibacter lekithochrous]